MTPDQKFARWIKLSIGVFIIVFAYFLLADLKMPLTPQAMATRVVTKVTPNVSGQIIALNVHNNQLVKKGELLFSIDPAPYLLAVEKAQLNLEQMRRNNQQLDASIAATTADIQAARIIAQQKLREAKRLKTLFKRNGISQQKQDEADSAATSAQEKLLAAQAHLQELQISRGDHNEKNLNLRIARNQLKQAQLNLSYTQVKAEQEGIITNLQLQAGSYASSGQPLLALVSSQVDIIADFREKSSRYVHTGSPALIAFDRDPGQIYSAFVTSLDAGVSAGQFAANGNLATPTTSNRWVRDAQRMRLHLKLDGECPDSLPTGAQATVQLLPENRFFAWLGCAQIHLLSMLHYIY